MHKAKVACLQPGQPVENHFGDVNEMVEIGSGAAREIEDIKLTSYALRSHCAESCQKSLVSHYFLRRQLKGQAGAPPRRGSRLR